MKISRARWNSWRSEGWLRSDVAGARPAGREHTKDSRRDRKTKGSIDSFGAILFPQKVDIQQSSPEAFRGCALSLSGSLVSVGLIGLGGDRTHDEKGLRDRNSPTCTLSQNGYGDLFRTSGVRRCRFVPGCVSVFASARVYAAPLC